VEKDREPFWIQVKSPSEETMQATHATADVDIVSTKQRLQELHALQASGTITQEAFDAERIPLERRILDWALKDAVAASAISPLPAAVSATAEKLSVRLFAMLALAVLILAGVGYSVTSGSLLRNGGVKLAGSQTQTPVGGGNGATQPHATNADQIGSMIDKLAAKLKANPQDAAGWAMLARSYGALGRSVEAVDAYANAEKLSPNDAGLLVDYADALAVKNDRKLAGEPMKLIERALKLDPRNIKGLAMAGTDAFDHKDYRKAVKLWESMVEVGGGENMFAQQVQPKLVEARQLAGLPPKAAAPVAAAANPGKSADSGAAGIGVSGLVTLSVKLMKDASPEDSLFIFARPANGSRMPLAILRKQVKDLPFQFLLDDNLSMPLNAKLSQAGTVVVGARISKSGQAIPAKGDLLGLSNPVPVGTTGLKIEINAVVAQ
jgi:cytochrome c-type biogenesis protein CcmH